jgi:hypothetical protein
LLSNARNRWRRASDDTSRAIRLKLADHGSPLRFILCATLIVAAKVMLYPSLTTAVQPIGSGGIDFIGCALIGDLPTVLLHPFSGYLAMLPRLLAEALGSLMPPLYLPQAFYWLSLISGALFCALLVLPQFAVVMPSVTVRIGAALFLGTWPDYAANLPENIAVLGFIPLLWLGLLAGESKNWSTLLLAAAAGAVLMLSKPVLLIAAPAFFIAGIAALFTRNGRMAVFHSIVTVAALLQVAYMATLGSLPDVTQRIHALDGQSLNAWAGDAAVAMIGTIDRILGDGHAPNPMSASAVAIAGLALLVIAAVYTLRHARTKSDLGWLFGSMLAILTGALAASLLTTARPVLPIVIAIVIAVAALQPFERITWTRRTGWVIGLVLLAGAANNLPQSHDPIDPAKGYTDWERTHFLIQDEHFALPVDADASSSSGPELWLMENEAGFLNSDDDIAHGRPKPLGSHVVADYQIDLSKYESRDFLGAIVPLRPEQAGKPVEMEVIDGTGERKKATLGIPLPNGSRYFLFDRPIANAASLHFSIGGSPEPVNPAIALIGDSPRAPHAESVCAMPSFFHLKAH